MRVCEILKAVDRCGDELGQLFDLIHIGIDRAAGVGFGVKIENPQHPVFGKQWNNHGLFDLGSF